MAIDLGALGSLIDLNDPKIKALFDAIKPYMPVLKRLGRTAIDTFVEGVTNRDWARIDRELYAQMTEDERDQMSSEVLRDAREVVHRAYETSRQWKDDLTRLLLGIALSFI